MNIRRLLDMEPDVPKMPSPHDPPICPDCHRPLQIGDYPVCGGDGDHRSHGGTLLSAIHPSERTVVYRNPRTGEVRFPARNDQPIPAVYAAQGYERRELRCAAEVRQFEKDTGRLHERSHYDPGSATAERDIAASGGKASGGKNPFAHVKFERVSAD